jgi:hypothetical protein
MVPQKTQINNWSFGELFEGGFFAGDLQRMVAPLAAAGLTSAAAAAAAASQLRPQATPLGAPLILSPRLPPGMSQHTAASLLNGSAGQQTANHLLAAAAAAANHQGPGAQEAASLMFAPYSDAYTTYAALASPLFAEYNAAAAAAATADHTGGLFAR